MSDLLVWTKNKEDPTQLSAKGNQYAYSIWIDPDGSFQCVCSNGEMLHINNAIWTERTAMNVAESHNKETSPPVRREGGE